MVIVSTAFRQKRRQTRGRNRAKLGKSQVKELIHWIPSMNVAFWLRTEISASCHTCVCVCVCVSGGDRKTRRQGKNQSASHLSSK